MTYMAVILAFVVGVICGAILALGVTIKAMGYFNKVTSEATRDNLKRDAILGVMRKQVETQGKPRNRSPLGGAN